MQKKKPQLIKEDPIKNELKTKPVLKNIEFRFTQSSVNDKDMTLYLKLIKY